MAADNAFGMRLTAETESPAPPPLRPIGDFVWVTQEEGKTVGQRDKGPRKRSGRADDSIRPICRFPRR